MSLLTALAVFQVCFPPPVQIDAGDGTMGDHFGIAVDQDGDRIVVGADNRTLPSTGFHTGSVYVYDRVGASWVQQAILEPAVPPTSGGFGFGRAVACDGDFVAVGAPKGSPPPTTAGGGLAYVYRLSGGQWLEEAILVAKRDDELFLPHEFGNALALRGTTLLVGAPASSLTMGRPGRVYAYERGAAGWAFQGLLVPSDGRPGDIFGWTIQLDGNIAYVGAFSADGLQPKTGAVYTFTRSGGVWTQQAIIVASDGKTDDGFGFSLSADGNGLVIGSPGRKYDSSPTTPAGGVYVFAWNGAQWVERQLLLPADINFFQHSGQSVALEGDTLVVGAPNQIFTSGYFHLYSRGPTGWIEHLKYAPHGAQGADNAGCSLSLESGRLVAGAQRWDALDMDTGAVHVYQLPPADPQPTFYCTAKIDSTGCLPRIYHVGLPSVSQALAGVSYAIRAWDLRPASPAMLFYSTQGAASTPFAGGLLCLQPPVKRTQAISTGGSATTPCHGQPLFDFNAWIASGNDPLLTAGREVWMQYWYRDPGGPPGQDVGLTSAIRVELCP